MVTAGPFRMLMKWLIYNLICLWPIFRVREPQGQVGLQELSVGCNFMVDLDPYPSDQLAYLRNVKSPEYFFFRPWSLNPPTDFNDGHTEQFPKASSFQKTNNFENPSTTAGVVVL